MGKLRRYVPFLAVAAGAAVAAFGVAVLRDIRASDPAVQGAVVGALAGVAGGIVGSAVGAWGVLTADERRWHHEDQARRTLRGVEVAREVRHELLAAAELFSWKPGYVRFNELPEAKQKRRHGTLWAPPTDEAIDVHTTRAVDLAVEIPEEPVRALVKLAATGLGSWDDAERWGAGHSTSFCLMIGREVDVFLGAYIRADDLPETPETSRVVAVLEDFWAEMRNEGAEVSAADEEARDV